MNTDKGKIIIISSPSGGGKTSICLKLLTPERKAQGWKFSVSYTTREKRPHEEDGREYVFVSGSEFDRKQGEGFFAEDCWVHGYHYGTPRNPLESTINGGGVMILDIDVQGAFKLKREFPQAITIFVLPPSKDELRRRLVQRGTETETQVKVRFDNARDEIQHYKKFEYCVINQDLDTAVTEVLAIITAHHTRTENIREEQIRRLLV